MGAMDRFRIKNRAYLHGLDVLGDGTDGGADNKTLAVNALAEMGSTIASTIAQKQAADANAESNREKNTAIKAAAMARKAAQLAAADALVETDPNGPLHKIAQKADAMARVAEAKAAFYTGGGKTASFSPSHAARPWWHYALGAAGVGLVGTLGYKALKR